MGLTIDEALQHVAPDVGDGLPDDQREAARRASAQRIVEGVAANESYWNSRPELEQVFAQVTGHGTVSRGSDEAPPPAVEAQTGDQPVIDGTASTVEEPGTEAAAEPGSDTPPPSASPDNPVESVAALRKQLEDAGITPEA